MLITFFSNYLNHHQIPFCDEMYKLLNKQFVFVQTQEMGQERINMGWLLNKKYPYVINSYENEEKYIKCKYLGVKSDVVIIGAAPDDFIEERVKLGKLTFKYSERIFKKGYIRILHPRIFVDLYRSHTKYRNNNIFMLCASAYAAKDFERIFAYKDKMYKWGYFPEFYEYNTNELLLNKSNDHINLLWVGRFISCKHAEIAIMIANMLSKYAYKFTLNIIGSGAKEQHLKRIVNKYNLEDKVYFRGNLLPEEVRKYMENANIFLCTSDRREGWGAVVNEAMNSGCAVVASRAVGSVPFLINDGINGFVYNPGNVSEAFNKVKILIEDKNLRERIALNAYKTIREKWNASVATARLLKLIGKILSSEKADFIDGPCSKAGGLL